MNNLRYLYDEIELMKEGEWSSKYHYSNDSLILQCAINKIMYINKHLHSKCLFRRDKYC